MDSTIPRKRLADILLAIAQMEKKYGLRCANVFHAGDGNLHPLILFDANDADQLHRCELFGADILETSVAMGGTVTGEHGVGVEKLNSMCVQFSEQEREQMLGVKRGVRPRRHAQPGQGDSHAAPLRRVRAHACQEGPAAVPRAGTLLGSAATMNDDPALRRLVDRVLTARDTRTPLCLRGHGSKDFYGEAPRGEPLDMTPLAGIAHYEPTELVVTVRAGTPLAELEAVLAAQGQCLAFEPPRFAGAGTVGGMVAAGLSGPSRAAVGSVRDFVLGAALLDGNGELLSFGGEVMKNVAGYDISRVLAGSLGILGPIVEVSLKVLPLPPARTTLRFEWREPRALQQLQQWAGQPLPLRASAWWNDMLVVQLAGAEAAVRAAVHSLGGERIEPAAAEQFWSDLRDQRDEFFSAAGDAVRRRRHVVAAVGGQHVAAVGHCGRAAHRMGRRALRWVVNQADAATMRDAGGAAMAATPRSFAAPSAMACSRRCRRRWRASTAS